MNTLRTYNSKSCSLARTLRKNLTDSEKRLWYFIRRKQILGIQFYRQKPIGPYIVDFYAPSVSLVIELDGSQHFEPEALLYDEERTNYLKTQKLDVLRFTNAEVMKQAKIVLETIFNFISTKNI
ncbi:MAG: endonuclease domain-containing protein [Pseudomonadota bacterium]